MPDVSDPLLETPPPPTNILQSWQQALQLVRDQSVSMRLARVNVQRAEAQVKSALAPALPQLLGTAGVTKYLIKGEVPNGAGGTNSIPNPSTYWNAQLGLTVPIFRPFAWSNYGSTKDAVEATKLSAKETERQVVAGFASVIVTVELWTGSLNVATTLVVAGAEMDPGSGDLLVTVGAMLSWAVRLKTTSTQ